MLTVLTELRNTIHAVPLDPLAVVKGRAPMLNDLLQAVSAASFPDAPAAPSEDFWARFPGDPAQVYRWQIGLSSHSA